MENHDSKRLSLSLSLAQLAAKGADATRLASAIVSTWIHIESVLMPVVGKRGFAALYARSLHMACAGHDWLTPADEAADDTVMNLTLLKTALLQQDSASAATGGGAHLQAFYELLGSLIGPSLTERMLDSIWEQSLTTRPSGETHHDPQSKH